MLLIPANCGKSKIAAAFSRLCPQDLLCCNNLVFLLDLSFQAEKSRQTGLGMLRTQLAGLP